MILYKSVEQENMLNLFNLMYWTLRSTTIKQTYNSHHLLWLRSIQVVIVDTNFPVKIHDGALQKQRPDVFYENICSQKCRNIHRKAPVLGSHFYKGKWDSNRGAYPRILMSFKITHFEEHLQMAASLSFLNTLKPSWETI